MSSVPPPAPRPEDEVNPFAAPGAGVEPERLEVTPGSAEAIRREHINHEASIKAVGTLYYLSSGFLLLSGVMVLVDLGSIPADMRAILAGQAIFNAVLASVFVMIGYGLRRLLPWGRWLAVGAICTIFVLSLGNITYTAMSSPELAGFTAGVVVVSSLIPLTSCTCSCRRRGGWSSRRDTSWSSPRHPT